MMSPPDAAHRLSWWSVFILIFSSVASGPANTEAVVGAAGLSLGVIFMALFPFLWGYVQALATAELAMRYPDANGGLAAWALKLFGPRAALNAAVWTIVANASTAALASESTGAYIITVMPGVETYGHRVALTMGVIAASLAVNMVGLRFVTQLCTAFTFHGILAFAVLCGLSVPRIDTSRFDSVTSSARTVRWDVLLNVLVYISTGYDNFASVIESVAEPRKVIPTAMLAVAVVVSVMSCVTVALPYLATSSPAADWVPGHFAVAAREIGGPWLQRWIVVAAALSNTQMYIVCLSAAAYTACSMAERGVFPRWLAIKARDVPAAALAACAALSILFGLLPLHVNLAVQAILLCAVVLAEIVCFLEIDSARLLPDMRPLRWLFIVPAIALGAWVIAAQETMALFAVLAGSLVCATYVASGRQPTSRIQPRKGLGL